MQDLLPFPALVVRLDGCWRLDADGGGGPLSRAAAARLAVQTPVLLVNAPLVAARLGSAPLGASLDLLELFAFVRPAQFSTPTVAGLSQVLGLGAIETGLEEAQRLRDIAAHLLAENANPTGRWRAGAYGAAQALRRVHWPWGELVAAHSPAPLPGEASLFLALPEWEDVPPRPRPRDVRLTEGAVQEKLAALVGPLAEERVVQRQFAAAAMAAFQPRAQRSAPNLVLAEAGTGVGKTLAYLAPAATWAQESGGAVWVSTYTKALQRQLAQEMAKLWPDPVVRAERAVVRKGRENYLCLLNLEDAVQGAFTGRAAVLAQLTARWARYSQDGDMMGGDFPGWLLSLFGSGRLAALTDRRGECVYASCPHYSRCFIERATRKAAQADIVVANHALMIVNAVKEQAATRSEGAALGRLVFDEGHHLFEAADSAFAVHLTGLEALDMRRWLLGSEGRGRGRRRGLETRLAELVPQDAIVAAALADVLTAAQALPAEGWLGRVQEAQPFGPFETLLAAVRDQVYTRSPDDGGYGLECAPVDLSPVLHQAATAARAALLAMSAPLRRLEVQLGDLLSPPPDWLDRPLRARIEGAISGIGHRTQRLNSWISLLDALNAPPASVAGPSPAGPSMVDWLAVERADGRELDMGLHRHWLDPTKPFADLVLAPAQGALIASATLRDRGVGAENEADWQVADARTGAQHLALPPHRFTAASPFDYAAMTRIFIVTDVRRGDIAQASAAYRALIEASGGGVLGLFTAISRLKAVHSRLVGPLAEAGLSLLAQHVDPIDVGTLVDMFRADRHTSLLGTDALRDGVDVPGVSLRQVIFEGVPWPRPSLLHAARRGAFGGSEYDDLLTRAKLAQAFGRLIRRASDKGVFVLLGAGVPSRLLTAFPAGAPVQRVTLAEAVRQTRAFLYPGLGGEKP